MTYDEFKSTLKELGLSKHEFSNMVGFTYNSINNWNNHINKPVPTWVDSWLENYRLAKRYKEIKERLKDL